MTYTLIDAYNIARPYGTGVATYGRNLARAVAGLGHSVDLLFCTQAGHARQPLLIEIGLAEGDEGATASRKRLRQPRPADLPPRRIDGLRMSAMGQSSLS